MLGLSGTAGCRAERALRKQVRGLSAVSKVRGIGLEDGPFGFVGGILAAF